jgi:hypothetical protein
MAEINDLQVKRYVTAFVRPSSNTHVGLKAAVDTELQTWFSSISGLLSGYDDDDVIIDDSQTDGTMPLTKANLTAYITQMIAYQTMLDAAGVMPIVSHPHTHIDLP